MRATQVRLTSVESGEWPMGEREVGDVVLGSDEKEFLAQLRNVGGFMAKKLWDSIQMIEKMLKDASSLNIISFPADIIATGCRGVIRDIIRKRYFDAIVTTCGTIDHDLARTVKPYYQGKFFANDLELARRQFHRLGNVFIPNESYGDAIEKCSHEFLVRLWTNGRRRLRVTELICELGTELRRKPNREASIIYWAAENRIPLYVPGIVDGAFGNQIWLFNQHRPELILDVEKDIEEFVYTLRTAKRIGLFVIGGGTSGVFLMRNALDNSYLLKDGQRANNSKKPPFIRMVFITSTYLKYDPLCRFFFDPLNKKHENIESEFLICDATIALPIIFRYLMKILG